jgi:hypothetical protein
LPARISNQREGEMDVMQDQSGVLAMVVDGDIVSEDGEVLGPADAFEIEEAGGSLVRARPLSRPPIHSVEDAESLLRRVAEIRAQAFAAEVQLRAARERLEREQRRHDRHAEWLLAQAGPELEAVARRELAGGKRRSLSLASGTLAFRKTQGTTTIHDHEAAILYAERSKPGAIVVEKRLPLKAAVEMVQEDLQAGLLDDVPNWISLPVPGEVFRIETIEPGVIAMAHARKGGAA